ncbi:MAG: ATP-dependent Clp protease ATP-binding subunit ClpX [Chloroherpetonaceae bacterium]
MGKTDKTLICSFCGKASFEVEQMFEGVNGAHICNNCVETAHNILERESTQQQNLAKFTLPKPSEIKANLDQYVIGQDDVKITLSVAVYNHYKRIFSKEKDDDVEIEKSNILLIGPTGTGKTLLARTLARTLNVPFAIADATTITEAGYVGDDVESVLLNLLQNADYDVAAAEHGIIFIDEIDKITRKSESASITRDVSGEGVQQALLKILEGTRSGVPPKGGRKHPEQSLVYINTKDILFIVGGAFDGLDGMVARRMGKSTIGFNAKPTRKIQETYDLLKDVEPDDLVKYGFIPELVGRLPVISALHDLDEDALLEILQKPKNALIKQYQKLFKMDNVDLIFQPEALLEIVRKAKLLKTGARGLRGIVESTLKQIMFEIPEVKNIKKVIITPDVVKNKALPIYEFKKEAKTA